MANEYEIALDSCHLGLSLELEFVPYQLSHCRFKSDNHHHGGNDQIMLNDIALRLADETVWLLGGSDRRIHVYAEDKTRHMYTEVNFSNTQSN